MSFSDTCDDTKAHRCHSSITHPINNIDDAAAAVEGIRVLQARDMMSVVVID